MAFMITYFGSGEKKNEHLQFCYIDGKCGGVFTFLLTKTYCRCPF